MNEYEQNEWTWVDQKRAITSLLVMKYYFIHLVADDIFNKALNNFAIEGKEHSH